MIIKAMNRLNRKRDKAKEKDEKKASAAMAGFEKVVKTYPYPHEIEGEREMIAYAESKLAN